MQKQHEPSEDDETPNGELCLLPASLQFLGQTKEGPYNQLVTTVLVGYNQNMTEARNKSLKGHQSLECGNVPGTPGSLHFPNSPKEDPLQSGSGIQPDQTWNAAGAKLKAESELGTALHKRGFRSASYFSGQAITTSFEAVGFLKHASNIHLSC